MNFNLISIKEKILLVVLALVAIIFIGAQLLIAPAASALSTDNATLATVDISYQQAQYDVANAEKNTTDMTKLLTTANKAASPLLPSPNKPSLHVWLFGIAKSCGLDVQSATFSDPSAATPTADATATVGATATTGTTSSEVTYNMKTYADAYLGKTSSATSTTSSATSTTSSATSSTSSTTSSTSSATSSTSSTSSSASSSTSSTSSTASVPLIGDAAMVSVSLEMTGSYTGAKAFLDAIKRTNKYVVINSFACTKKGEIFTCSVTLQCYAAEKLDNSKNIFDWTIAAPSGRGSLM